MSVDSIIAASGEAQVYLGPGYELMFCRSACEVLEHISMEALVVQ